MENPEANVLRRLRKIEGQVKGVERMVEQQRPCDEVLIQVMAARAALDQVATQVVGKYVDECLASLPPDKAKESIARILQLITRIPIPSASP